MARTRLAVGTITSAGLVPPAEATADVVNGMTLSNDGRTALLVRNAGTATRTLTVRFAVTVEGQPVVPRDYLIPAGVSRYVGPFAPGWYGTALAVDADSTDLRLSAVQLGTPGPVGDTLTYAGQQLADGAVAAWSFANTTTGLLDATGNGHHATAVGSPTVGTWVDGAGALAFNGTSQYLEVADHAALSPAGGAITIEAWMAPAVTTFPVPQGGGDYIHWMGKIGANPADVTHAEYAGRMYQFVTAAQPSRSNRCSIYSFNPAATSDNPNHLGAGSYSQDVIVVGEWIYFALVINTVTGMVKQYRNSVLRDADPLSGYTITPVHTNAPLRWGTANLESFFQGKIARAAIYPYELSPTQIRNHFRAASPQPAGTGKLIGSTGAAATTASGTRLQLVVGASGVAAGSTLLARAGSAWTNAGTTMADSKGNIWARDRSSADAGTVIRSSMFSCQVQVALEAGDIVEMRAPVAVTAKAVAVDEFDHLEFSPVHAINATSNTSATPGGTLAITTTEADTLIHGMLAVAGPTTDGLDPDTGNEMTPLTRAGTASGSNDVTVNGAYTAVAKAGTQHWVPAMGTSRTWIETLAAYVAGTPVVSPPPQGSAISRGVLTSGASTTAGTTLQLTVPPGDGVPVGHSLVVGVSGDYTGAAPTVTDARGNTYPVSRTAAATGNVDRGAQYACAVATALQPGDLITITWSTSITRRAATVQQFSGVLTPITIDAQTGAAAASGSPSSTLTTVTANDLLVAVTAMAGPADAAFTPDVAWSPTPTVGTTGNGAADRTVYLAHRAVVDVGGYAFSPVLDGTYPYALLLVAYRAA